MSEALSIFAAARDAAAAPGLLLNGAPLTFAELAALTERRVVALGLDSAHRSPYPLVATNTLDTLVTLYALLETRVPALLIHPKLTSAEQGAQIELARQMGGAPHADAAVILHTSGTTGLPRAAVLTRSALVASAAASASNLGWQDRDCWLLCLPIARVGGLSIVTRCLAARRPLALAARFAADRLPAWIDAWHSTLVSLVPTMLSQVLDAHRQWTAPAHLRAILLGGSAATERLLQRASDRRLPIVVAYGLTETASQVVATPYAGRFAPASRGVGTPLPGIDVRVRDGRIEVRGRMLMAGYWGESALESGAWFDTGDLGAIDQRGCLWIHARRTDLIITGGENVYPAEVERVLECIPGIIAAGVFGVPSETWGQTVAAALVAEASPPCDRMLIDHVATRLADYKHPRHVCFVPGLPMTPAGKIDRAALLRLAGALRPVKRCREAPA